MLNSRMMPVGSIATRYVDVGEGEAIVLIHGFPETLQGWRHNVPELAKQFRVVAPDLVGFGRSDHVDWDYSCAGLASFVKRFLEARGIQRAHVVGADTGTLVALALAARHPDTVQKLVICAGTAYQDSISALDVRMMMAPLIGEIGLLLAGSFGLRQGIRRGCVDPARMDEQVVAEYLDCLSSFQDKRIALRLMRELGRGAPDIMAQLKKRTPPTMILWADHETHFYPWVPIRLRDDLPGARLERFINCGHFLQEEQPERFNRLLIDFLTAPAR